MKPQGESVRVDRGVPLHVGTLRGHVLKAGDTLDKAALRTVEESPRCIVQELRAFSLVNVLELHQYPSSTSERYAAHYTGFASKDSLFFSTRGGKCG